MAKTALVTGGAGFIGSHVTDEILKLGIKVIVLDDLTGGSVKNVNPAAKFIKGSIVNQRLIKKIFRENKIDYIYHLAAYAAEGLSHFIKHFNYENNLIGSVNLINAAVNNRVKCFIFTSSIAVYGKNQLPMTEDLVPQPEDSYGIAKFCVEKELQSTKQMFGLDYIIFRPHNVYGERQNIGDKYRNVIGIFMNQIMSGKALSIFGDGKQTRAFTYISDVAPIIAKSPFVKKAVNEIFNIGAEKKYTVNQLAKLVTKTMTAKSKILHFPARNEVKHAYSENSKVKKVFKYTPACSIEEGLTRMAKWALKIGVTKSKQFKNIEIAKNLPPSWKK